MNLNGSVRTVDDHILNFFRQILERCIKAEFVLLGKCAEHGVTKAGVFVGRLPSHHNDTSVIDGKALVRDHEIRIKLHLVAKSHTVRACAEGIVEGKASGLDLRNTDSTVRTRKTLAKAKLLSVYYIHKKKSLRKLKGILYGIRKSAAEILIVISYHNSVYDNLDVVLNILIKLDLLFGNVILAAIDPGSYITCTLSSVQSLLVFTLFTSDNRCKDLELGSVAQGHDLIAHLIHSLSADLSSAIRTVRNTDPGIEKSEVIVDLRNCSNGRSRVLVG